MEQIVKLSEIAASVSGGLQVRDVRQKLNNLQATDRSKNRLTPIYMRAALGQDSGNYLRADVLPLATCYDAPEYDKKHLQILDSNTDASARLGLFSALRAELTKQRGVERKRLESTALRIGWLLTMNEISDHVRSHIQATSDTNQKLIDHLTQIDKHGVTDEILTRFAKVLCKGTSLEVTERLRTLIEPLLMALAEPLTAAIKQRAFTTSTDANKKRAGLKRVAMAVASSSTVKAERDFLNVSIDHHAISSGHFSPYVRLPELGTAANKALSIGVVTGQIVTAIGVLLGAIRQLPLSHLQSIAQNPTQLNESGYQDPSTPQVSFAEKMAVRSLIVRNYGSERAVNITGLGESDHQTLSNQYKDDVPLVRDVFHGFVQLTIFTLSLNNPSFDLATIHREGLGVHLANVNASVIFSSRYSSVRQRLMSVQFEVQNLFTGLLTTNQGRTLITNIVLTYRDIVASNTSMPPVRTMEQVLNRPKHIYDSFNETTIAGIWNGSTPDIQQTILASRSFMHSTDVTIGSILARGAGAIAAFLAYTALKKRKASAPGPAATASSSSSAPGPAGVSDELLLQGTAMYYNILAGLHQAATLEIDDSGMGYCETGTNLSEDDRLNALCAGMHAMFEGPALTVDQMNLLGLSKLPGVSPFWNARQNPPTSWWIRQLLFTDGGGGVIYPKDYTHPNNSDYQTSEAYGPRVDGLMTLSPDNDVAFCIARGVLGIEGPHQAHGRGGNAYRGASLLAPDVLHKNTLAYAVFSFPDISYSYESEQHPTPTGSSSVLDRNGTATLRSYGNRPFTAVSDYVSLPGPAWADPIDRNSSGSANGADTPDVARIAIWLPIEKQEHQPTTMGFVPSTKPYWQSICHATTWEYLIDHYARVAKRTQTDRKEREFSLACRAAAKMAQLESMAKVINALPGIDTEAKHLLNTEPKRVYITRPCLPCERGDNVLWPIDAGLACFQKHTTTPTLHGIWDKQPSAVNFAQTCIDSTNLPPGSVDVPESARLQEIIQDNLVRSSDNARRSGVSDVDDYPTITAVKATMDLHATIGNDVNGLYLAMPAEHTPFEFSNTKPAARIFNTTDIKSNALSVDALHSMLTQAIATLDRLSTLKCEEEYIDKETTRLRTSSADNSEYALRRRALVFDDALKEAAISGDRLWSFAKQLAGITSESVESIMILDDTALVREQADQRKLREHVLSKANEQHFRVVEQLFKSALTDSGIQLGVTHGEGDEPQLNLLSTGVRKKLVELSNRPQEANGFFSNSVQLENLISGGAGDMSIDTLFDQLRQVGQKMHQIALESLPSNRGTAIGTSMDVIGAPRNCLFIHWKPQAKSAIRQAFDIFTRERRYIEPNMRDILAWELIEGVSEPLCNAFAELCGLMMANARMTNPTNMVYVSQQSMSTTGRAIKLSISRLINEACRYSSQHGRPSLDAKGVDAYFGLT